MRKHRFPWLLIIALATQLLSPAVSALGVFGNGIWSVSCTGNPVLLPLPGEEPQTHAGHAGACYLCCDEPRKNAHTVSAALPLQVDAQATPGYAGALLAATTVLRTINHPTRAPPAHQ